MQHLFVLSNRRVENFLTSDPLLKEVSRSCFTPWLLVNPREQSRALSNPRESSIEAEKAKVLLQKKFCRQIIVHVSLMTGLIRTAEALYIALWRVVMSSLMPGFRDIASLSFETIAFIGL